MEGFWQFPSSTMLEELFCIMPVGWRVRAVVGWGLASSMPVLILLWDRAE